jgi:glycine/D-amino acid oxidase-like deaminating enzyme
MDTTVRSDLPFLDSKRLCAVIGQEYDAWVNRYGALCAIFDDGEMLGLKPYEFTVVAWHEAQQSVHPTNDGLIHADSESTPAVISG